MLCCLAVGPNIIVILVGLTSAVFISTNKPISNLTCVTLFCVYIEPVDVWVIQLLLFQWLPTFHYEVSLMSIFMLVHSVRSTLLNVFSQMLRMMSADLRDVCWVLSVGCYSQLDFSAWPSGLGYSRPLGLGPQNISF